MERKDKGMPGQLSKAIGRKGSGDRLEASNAETTRLEHEAVSRLGDEDRQYAICPQFVVD